MNWHGIVLILQWLLLSAGVVVLARRDGWNAGVILMAVSLLFQAIGGLVSIVVVDLINQHQAHWVPMLVWTVSTLAFAGGFLLVSLKRKGPRDQKTSGPGT